MSRRTGAGAAEGCMHEHMGKSDEGDGAALRADSAAARLSRGAARRPDWRSANARHRSTARPRRQRRGEIYRTCDLLLQIELPDTLITCCCPGEWQLVSNIN